MNTSKIIIETMVRKALKDIKKSPNRAMRNLVDMGLHFSNGRFQTYFFELAQTMLQNEKSSFYALVPALVADIDTERIVRFGMNVGYNSCTHGAGIIRDMEAAEGFNIPWSVSFRTSPAAYTRHEDAYRRLLQDGKSMGIYTWQLFTERQPEVIFPLVEEHEDCAFILYCDPDDLTLHFLDRAAELNNLMLVIRYDEHTPEVYETLWDSGLLYSVLYEYDDDTAAHILSGDLLTETEQIHPVFTALMANKDCTIETQQAVYDYVQKTRAEQVYLTIPWEVAYDSCFVDTIISGDPCSLGFDEQGTIYTMYQSRPDWELNLFRNDLRTILKQAFPKS